MTKLTLKELKEVLKEKGYYIRKNNYSFSLRLVIKSLGCNDTIIAYLTFNQFMKLNLIETNDYTSTYTYFKLKEIND